MRKPSWLGARGAARRARWLRRVVMPPGREDPEAGQAKRAAAADVARIEEDGRPSGPDRPGGQQDEL
jgi:hypothetical protein